MKQFIDLVTKILDAPGTEWKPNRTGVKTKAISGYMLEHDMRDGFPMLTTRKMFLKNAAIELEFFIKGLTDKRWLQERGNHFWDNWCNPKKVPYGHDAKTKSAMRMENDLGPIYGFQWRNFNGHWDIGTRNYNDGVDQLKKIVDMLKKDPSDRRMICSAWNPTQLSEMALPPCHLLWQVVVTGEKLNVLNLNWYQRSCDTMIGIPYDLLLYGLLLTLLAKEANMIPGKLCGMLGDVHIYENQLEGAYQQLKRHEYFLPNIGIPDFKSIYDWTYNDLELYGYVHHPIINFPLSV